jgi:hypothetical protein
MYISSEALPSTPASFLSFRSSNRPAPYSTLNTFGPVSSHYLKLSSLPGKAYRISNEQDAHLQVLSWTREAQRVV